jgi:hypothetical protein
MKHKNSNGANLGFENKLWEMADKQLANIRECQTLATLRNALLPKLISGEPHLPAAVLELVTQAGVPDADKLIEAVSYD